MATTNSTATMAGLFKQIYGENVIDLTPMAYKIQRTLDFKYAESLGDKFNQPVDLTQEHGITYAAAGTEPTLEQPTAGQMQNAQVDGAQIYARSRVNYEAMDKASAAGAKAFQQATSLVVRRLTRSAGKALEISLLHGRRGRGTIATVGAVDATHRTWVISDASWAAGIWAGSVNQRIDVYAANYSGSAVNSNAAVIITAVNMDTKTLTVSGNATDLTAILAGMHLFQRTASPTSEMAGIDAIIRNTGTLFNVDAATYELWKGNVVSSVGAISMNVVLDGVRRAVELGLEDDTACIVSPRAFQVLNNDVAALRKYDSSYRTKEGENGVEEIIYYGQSGTTRILPHLFQKDGQAHIIAPREWRRIGAKDLGFITRHGTNEKLILEVADSPASEMRCSFNGAAFCEAPAHAVVLDGITYS